MTLHYVRASHGLDTWEEHVILAPLGEESPWESATLFEPRSLDLDHDPPDDATFVTPPSGSVGKQRFRSYAQAESRPISTRIVRRHSGAANP